MKKLSRKNVIENPKIFQKKEKKSFRKGFKKSGFFMLLGQTPPPTIIVSVENKKSIV